MHKSRHLFPKSFFKSHGLTTLPYLIQTNTGVTYKCISICSQIKSSTVEGKLLQKRDIDLYVGGFFTI